MKLTEAGRALLDGAGRVLTELDGAITAARRAAAGELGGVRLAFSWSARFETLPSLGQAFRASHPGVELVTEQMWNARMPDALRAGAIDIALSICPEVAGDLSYQLVRREAVLALLPVTIDSRARARSRSPRWRGTSTCSSRATWPPTCTTSSSACAAAPASSPPPATRPFTATGRSAAWAT